MKELFDKKILDQIGFTKIVSELDLTTPYGKETFNNLSLYNKCQFDELQRELSWVEKTIAYISNKSNYVNVKKVMGKLKNISDIVIKCQSNTTLTTVDLFEVKYHSHYFNELMNLLNNQLNIDDLLLIDSKDILNLLSEQKESNHLEFHVYNAYSQTLTNIRKDKLEIEKDIYKTKDKSKRDELLEKRALITEEEKKEELVVRKQLSFKLSKMIDVLDDNIKKIGYIDFLIEKAKVALKYEGIKPQINDNKDINFKNLVNPYLKELVENKGYKYQSVDIEITKGCTVITGANMSGKSSILKSIFLNVLLAHLGFYVFASSANINLFDQLKYINSSIDDPNNGLSSFGYEIKNINEILNSVNNEKMFICIDECFKSTNPVEGQKFVRALVRYLNKTNSYTIITTHYDRVASDDTKHYQVKGLSHLDDVKMEGASVNLLYSLMDYQLDEIDEKTPIPKEAKKVAKLLNINSDFLRIVDEVDEEG